jgi:hypothetical protein
VHFLNYCVVWCVVWCVVQFCTEDITKKEEKEKKKRRGSLVLLSLYSLAESTLSVVDKLFLIIL